MYNALLFIKEQLTENALITAQISADNIYPIIAAAEVEGDFITYTVSRDNQFTKDGLTAYTSDIEVFADDVLEAAQKADIVQLQLTTHEKIYGESAGVFYSQDLKRAYVKLIFTFKI